MSYLDFLLTFCGCFVCFFLGVWFGSLKQADKDQVSIHQQNMEIDQLKRRIFYLTSVIYKKNRGENDEV